MSDWEAEDYDPSEGLKDKLVTIGLDVKKEAKPVETGSTKPGELTEQEKHLLQLESDAELGADLLGLAVPLKKKKFEDFNRQSDFLDHANELGEQFVAKKNSPHYLLFTNTLVQHITQPMTKIQLEAIRDTIQQLINVHEKREEDEKKQQAMIKEQTKAKKANKKKLLEDTVDDEYDQYSENYY